MTLKDKCKHQKLIRRALKHLHILCNCSIRERLKYNMAVDKRSKIKSVFFLLCSILLATS